jgi:hypothetical protein
MHTPVPGHVDAELRENASVSALLDSPETNSREVSQASFDGVRGGAAGL